MNPKLGPLRFADLGENVTRYSFRKHYVKIISDIYLHTDVAKHPDWIAEALLMRCPRGVLRGFSALHNAGFSIPQENWTPMISVSEEHPVVKGNAGVILRQKDPKVSRINGKRSVSDAQAVVDVLKRPKTWGDWVDGESLEEHIALVDILIRQKYSLHAELKEFPEAKQVIEMANPLAESRPESLLRARLHLLGLKDFQPQIRVQGRDGFYFIDLGDAVLRLGLDYQGAHHFDAGKRAKDAHRMNDLRWAGWQMIEVTWEDLRDPRKWQKLESRIRRARQDALRARLNRLPPQAGRWETSA